MTTRAERVPLAPRVCKRAPGYDSPHSAPGERSSHSVPIRRSSEFPCPRYRSCNATPPLKRLRFERNQMIPRSRAGRYEVFCLRIISCRVLTSLTKFRPDPPRIAPAHSTPGSRASVGFLNGCEPKVSRTPPFGVGRPPFVSGSARLSRQFS